MTAAANFLLRNWQAVLGALAVAILATMLWIRTDQRDDARQAHEAEKAAYLTFRERTRAVAEAERARQAENVRRVEAAQARITQEVSNEYQDRIADLRRRADTLRLQLAAGRTHSGGGTGSVPRLPDASRGPDAGADDHGLSLAERVTATEQAIRLDELQRWVRRQVEVGGDE